MKSSVEKLEWYLSELWQCYHQSNQEQTSRQNLAVKSAHSFHFLCHTQNPV